MLDQPGPKAWRAYRVHKDPRDLLERSVRKGSLAHKVHKATRELLAQPEPWELQALPVLRGLLAQPELRVPQDPLVRRERSVRKALLVNKDRKELLAHKDQQGMQAQLGRPGRKVSLDLQADLAAGRSSRRAALS